MRKFLFILCAALCLLGCNKVSSNNIESKTGDLAPIGQLELLYATQYSVDFYENDYVHISVADGTDYIVVPENEKENNLGFENPVYIHMPCDSIYLAASSAMDLFLELNELGSISSCSTQADDYSMDEVKKAIEAEEIMYVGKYSAPDYELLLSKKCDLAIESTMISHSPKIKEQIERIGIPVFVERSSYEESPMGRLEWIKLYGVLTGKEKKANAFFDTELEKIKSITASNLNAQEDHAQDKEAEDEKSQNTKKTVAFFSITSTGYVTVRKPGDYICKMIEMAGGEYALNNLLIEEENSLSTINIGMEDFFREASNADILIYNGTIDGGVSNLGDFVGKNELLKEFKAVKEGHVWSTSLNMFQESSKIAEVIVEMSNLINEANMQENYLKHLE